MQKVLSRCSDGTMHHLEIIETHSQLKGNIKLNDFLMGGSGYLCT